MMPIRKVKIFKTIELDKEEISKEIYHFTTSNKNY